MDRPKFIVIECVPDEIETHHLNDLRHDLAQANQQYRRRVQHSSQAEINQEKLRLQERDRLREMKDRLKFD